MPLRLAGHRAQLCRTGFKPGVWFALPVLLLTVPLAAQRPGSASTDSTTRITLPEVAIGIGVIAAASTIDVPIANAFQDHRTAGSLNTARQFDRFGDLTGAVPILGGLAIASLVSHNHRLGKATLRAAASAALAALTTQAVKRVVGRERPVEDADLDGYDFHFFTNHQAFPSGHTAAAFALATSLGDGIGHSWARVGLFGLAAGTAWARMEEHEHWFSDVLAGAAVGILSSKWVSGRIRIFGLRAPRILIGPGTVAIMMPIHGSHAE
jgi:membrane-associated phospholipid phosphatase